MDKETIVSILEGAKENLMKDGYLTPVLFVTLKQGEKLMVPLQDLPQVEDRRLYVTVVGIGLRKEKGDITEAILVMESWFAPVEKSKKLNIPPSEHPQRMEAICLCGRNANNTRTSTVIQPFSRDANNKPRWEKVAIASFNEKTGSGSRPVGLLDYLFTDMRTH